jgi:coatomer subunit epsilon
MDSSISATANDTHDNNVNDHNDHNVYRQALLVQLYLRMDRLDLAQKQAKQLKTTDEDHTLTTLANAWVNLSTVRILS